MRIKDGFVLREVAGQAMVIATGEASDNFHGMVRLNETGKYVWQGITDGLTVEDIAHGLTEVFSVDYKKALDDVVRMIAQMENAGFLCQ